MKRNQPTPGRVSYRQWTIEELVAMVARDGERETEELQRAATQSGGGRVYKRPDREG